MVIRVVEFSREGYTRLERHMPKNQHTQWKLMNFENWCKVEKIIRFLGKNLSNFVSPTVKLNNLYYHDIHYPVHIGAEFF